MTNLATLSPCHPSNDKIRRNTMDWTVSNFGRRRGNLSLPQLLFRDPDFFFFKMRTGGLDPMIQAEANTIYARATSIKIPPINGIDHDAQYIINTSRRGSSFAALSFIRKNPPYPTSMTESDVIDMSYPQRLSRYNKGGYKRMIKDIKWLYFADRSHYMTRKRCEEFFDDTSHFV
jgi:hypothetical protein